jgi:hypothetical protein
MLGARPLVLMPRMGFTKTVMDQKPQLGADMPILIDAPHVAALRKAGAGRWWKGTAG